MRHSTPRKFNRPYSLLQALDNPVQDSNGFIHNSSIHIGGVCSSIDLQQSLEVSEVVLHSNGGSEDSDFETGSPKAAVTEDTTPPTSQDTTNDNNSQPTTDSQDGGDLAGIMSSEFDRLDTVNSNSNSNNNTQEPPPSCYDDLPNYNNHQYEPHYQTPSSALSDNNSIASGKLPKHLKLETDTSDGAGSGPEVPAWYMSPTPSPYCHDSTNMNPIESEFTTSDLFSPPSHPTTSPPGFISPIYDQHVANDLDPSTTTASATTRDTLYSSSSYSNSYNHDSPPLMGRSSPHYQSPLAFSHSVDNSHYDFVRPITKHQCPAHSSPSPYRGRSSSPVIKLKEKDFAIEYTLQRQMKPEVVYNRDCKSTSDADQANDGSGGDHIYNQPRVFSYSGRNTPETPRNGYKVYIHKLMH